MKYLILLLIIGCSQPIEQIDRQIPFEYDLSEDTLIVYYFTPSILYYSPEAFEIGWGKYEWDAYNQGAWCPDELGVKKITIKLDDRKVIRVLSREIDFIITIDEFEKNKTNE